MLDNTKFLTTNQDIINRVLLHNDFRQCRPKNNYYHSISHKDFGIKLSLDFRKAIENSKVVGFAHAEINLSPHYHKNNYLHNGDDFTPLDSITAVKNILQYLGVREDENELLKVVNIEFGANIIPPIDIKNLIGGLFYYKKTTFNNSQFPYFKKTNATAYKQIKAYAKGLQFADSPQFRINLNTFRFEVKSKQAKNIKTYGIRTALDLLKPETYKRLSQELIDEWEQCLLTNQTDDFSDLNNDDIQFIRNAGKFDFWEDLKVNFHRDKFVRTKAKYYEVLTSKNNLHHQIKLQIIDKLFSFHNVANSTQRTPINTGKVIFEDTAQNRINLEYATKHKNINVCRVTNIDISMQKKGSKFLCISGLKYYREHEPETYKKIEDKYLTAKMTSRPIGEQLYYIAHNIRNEKTNAKNNPIHNRKRFEQRNYHKQQLQFNFNEY